MRRPLLHRIFLPSPEKQLRRQYRHHSDPRHLDIDWTATNYNRIAIVNLLLADKPDGVMTRSAAPATISSIP